MLVVFSDLFLDLAFVFWVLFLGKILVWCFSDLYLLLGVFALRVLFKLFTFLSSLVFVFCVFIFLF